MNLGRFAGVQESRLDSARNWQATRVSRVIGVLPCKSILNSKESSVENIARRKFIQLSAVAAAGCLAHTSRSARADELPQLEEGDPMAGAMKYTHDAASVDPATRNNPAADQNCANCALVQGNDGDDWRPCQIFPGKSVAAAGWCSVWAPKA